MYILFSLIHSFNSFKSRNMLNIWLYISILALCVIAQPDSLNHRDNPCPGKLSQNLESILLLYTDVTLRYPAAQSNDVSAQSALDAIVRKKTAAFIDYEFGKYNHSHAERWLNNHATSQGSRLQVNTNLGICTWSFTLYSAILPRRY